MKVNTRLFDEIDVADEKIITLDKGIIGFPFMRKFTLIYGKDDDESKEKEAGALMWFQSLDEPQFALPVVSPVDILPEYNPQINDDELEPLGELNDENLLVLVTMKVPPEIEKMTINLKAPIIINTDTRLGGQIIVENDFQVQFPVYELLQKNRQK